MYKLFIILLLFQGAITGFTQPYNVKLLPQVHVFFDLGSHQLTPAAKHTIDSMIYADVLPPGRGVGIVGYADILGGEESNAQLSKKRANAVAVYLHSMGIDSTQIETITWNGEVARPDKPGGYPQDRKVAIIPGGFREKEKIRWTDTGTLIATIKFRFTSTQFLPQAMPLLDTVVSVLKKNNNMMINLDGYVCCQHFGPTPPKDTIGSGKTWAEFRLLAGDTLSMKRARAVYLYMTNRGIDASRIKCTGFGYRKPKYDAQGKFIHGIDRVEIRAVKK